MSLEVVERCEHPSHGPREEADEDHEDVKDLSIDGILINGRSDPQVYRIVSLKFRVQEACIPYTPSSILWEKSSFRR
jgi:hypothetical protein